MTQTLIDENKKVSHTLKELVALRNYWLYDKYIPAHLLDLAKTVVAVSADHSERVLYNEEHNPPNKLG